jgi:hypothetical protein
MKYVKMAEAKIQWDSRLTPRTTNSIKQIALFCFLGAALGALLWFAFNLRFWGFGIAIGGVVGFGVNWIRADLAWDKYE